MRNRMTAYEKLELHQLDIIRALVHEEFNKFIKKPGDKKDSDATSRETRYPTIPILHQKIQACHEIPNWKISTTRTVLSSMGFQFRLAHSINHAILIENTFIVQWRKKYVKKIQEHKRNDRHIFYFDESYIHQHHAPKWILHDTTIKSAADASSKGLTTGIPRPAGKGLRLIMVAMGSKDGFVDGSVELWKRTPKDGVVNEDYHSDINAEGFETWLLGVLPSLPPNSVIVFDNASYHSKKVHFLNCF